MFTLNVIEPKMEDGLFFGLTNLKRQYKIKLDLEIKQLYYESWARMLKATRRGVRITAIKHSKREANL
jgi:hypothetical protein